MSSHFAFSTQSESSNAGCVRSTLVIAACIALFGSSALAQAQDAGSAAPITQQAPAQTQAPDTATSPASSTPQAAPNAPTQPDVSASQPPEASIAVEQPAAAAPAQPSVSAERSDIPHNLSPLGMFMAADWVVKGVMIGLALASLLTWTVWLAKSLELFGARRRAKLVIEAIRQSKSLADALVLTEKRRGPAASMLAEAARELKLSEGALDHVEHAGVKERVASVLGRIEAYAGRRMMRGTGALATIGSVGPFVGLFGTVWGIMNSFIGISESQTTNLAVVAPGIAEALLATAIGLVAAIPAVVIYNIFARSITGYRQLLADAAAGVERLVSRDLDFRKVPPGGRVKSSVSLVAGE